MIKIRREYKDGIKYRSVATAKQNGIQNWYDVLRICSGFMMKAYDNESVADVNVMGQADQQFREL